MKTPSMLNSPMIDDERNYNFLLSLIVSLGPIACFRFVTKPLQEAAPGIVPGGKFSSSPRIFCEVSPYCVSMGDSYC